jgi:hypothetical protein
MKSIQFLLYSALFFCLLISFGCNKSAQADKVDELMSADKRFQFPVGFPPDPGEAGKKTLEGIDSDHDGLRDDIQRWIFARFSTEPKKRAALKQMALFYQSSLFIKNSPEEKKKNLTSLSKAIRCLDQNFTAARDDAILEGEYLRAKVLNTQERSKRYLEVDSWFNGMTSGSLYPEKGTACEN